MIFLISKDLDHRCFPKQTVAALMQNCVRAAILTAVVLYNPVACTRKIPDLRGKCLCRMLLTRHGMSLAMMRIHREHRKPISHQEKSHPFTIIRENNSNLIKNLPTTLKLFAVGRFLTSQTANAQKTIKIKVCSIVCEFFCILCFYMFLCMKC